MTKMRIVNEPSEQSIQMKCEQVSHIYSQFKTHFAETTLEIWRSRRIANHADLRWKKAKSCEMTKMRIVTEPSEQSIQMKYEQVSHKYSQIKTHFASRTSLKPKPYPNPKPNTNTKPNTKPKSEKR